MVSSTPLSHRNEDLPADALAVFQSTGSEAAFRSLTRHYYPMVFATALRRSDGNRGLSEDAAQLVLIALARQARKLRPATLGGWLHRHTCFTTSKLLRSDRRRLIREQKAATDSPCTNPESGPSIDDLLLGLPEIDRQIVMLRHLDGQSHDEIARLLGLTAAASKKRSERALHKLRAMLRESNAGESRFAGLLVPPFGLAAAPNADAAARAALSAPGASPVAGWWSHPIAGAALGSAAALALFAVPLVKVWNPQPETMQKSATPPPVAQSTPWKPIPGALPTYRGPTTPEDAVAKLIEIALTRGMEGDGERRAHALADELPANWRHEVMVGFAKSSPPDLATTHWFDDTMGVLAAKWQPRRLPEDLHELLPIVRDRNARRHLTKGCADFDRVASLALEESLPRDKRFAPTPAAAKTLQEDLQIGILSSIAATGDGKATLEYYLSLPGVKRADGTTRIAQQEFMSALRGSENLRRTVWQNLDLVSSDDCRDILYSLTYPNDIPSGIELSPAIRAHLDARRIVESIPSDNKSLAPMEEVLDAWESAIPEELRLEMAGNYPTRHQPTSFALARRLGEETGGGEFDNLRIQMVEAFYDRFQSGGQMSPDEVFAVAARIQNPVARFRSQQGILRRCGGQKNAVAYLDQYIPEAQRNIHRELLRMDHTDYPE